MLESRAIAVQSLRQYYKGVQITLECLTSTITSMVKIVSNQCKENDKILKVFLKVITCLSAIHIK